MTPVLKETQTTAAGGGNYPLTRTADWRGGAAVLYRLA